MAIAPEPEPLLVELVSRPDDVALRARAAVALQAHGRGQEAIGLLAALINLTAHDGPTLPCLCWRCLNPEQDQAEADGLRFVRRFVVAGERVLYYWAPIDLADDPGLTRTIQARLERRLAP
jgi:hypothetical protein